MTSAPRFTASTTARETRNALPLPSLSSTRIGRMLAFGATSATIPATKVPCPYASSTTPFWFRSRPPRTSEGLRSSPM